MQLAFTKMHGCGNDYIYINGFEYQISNPESLAKQLSDRHFGIGGDGIVLVLPSEIADAQMRMFNLDGSEAQMCGNAIRCVAKFLYDNGMVQKPQLTIETKSGIKTLTLFLEDNQVAAATVDMGAAELNPAKIPVNLPGEQVVASPQTIDGTEYAITCVSMGNPHCVVFCGDVAGLNLPEIGPKFENHPLFPERVNAEFVEVLDETHLKMRVWERGSGETLACGTGACATAVAAVKNGYCKPDTDIRVSLLGGELVIRYTPQTVFLTGGCQKVFDGTIEI